MSSFVFNDFKKRFLNGEVPSADNWNFIPVNNHFKNDYTLSGNFNLEQYRNISDFSAANVISSFDEYKVHGYKMNYTWSKVENDEDFSNKPTFIRNSNFYDLRQSEYWKVLSANEENLRYYIKTDYAREKSGEQCRGVKGFYLLRSKDELTWFANRANTGNNQIIGVLVDNIEGDIDNDPIGKEESYPFQGILDGNGFSIGGNIICSGVNNGLVGVLGTSGIVRNFKIDDTNIVCKKKLNLRHIKEDGRDINAGILVGKNYGTIENISGNFDLGLSGFVPEVYSVTNKSDSYNDFTEIRNKYSDDVSDNFYYLNSFCINSPGNICPYVGYFNQGLYAEKVYTEGVYIENNGWQIFPRRWSSDENKKIGDNTYEGSYYKVKIMNTQNYGNIVFDENSQKGDTYSYSFILSNYGKNSVYWNTNTIKEYFSNTADYFKEYYKEIMDNILYNPYNTRFIFRNDDSNVEESETKPSIMMFVPGNLVSVGELYNKQELFNFKIGEPVYKNSNNGEIQTYSDIFKYYRNLTDDSKYDISSFVDIKLYDNIAMYYKLTGVRGPAKEAGWEYVSSRINFEHTNSKLAPENAKFLMYFNGDFRYLNENNEKQYEITSSDDFSIQYNAFTKPSLNSAFFSKRLFGCSGAFNTPSKLDNQWIFDDEIDINNPAKSETEENILVSGVKILTEKIYGSDRIGRSSAFTASNSDTFNMSINAGRDYLNNKFTYEGSLTVEPESYLPEENFEYCPLNLFDGKHNLNVLLSAREYFGLDLNGNFTSDEIYFDEDSESKTVKFDSYINYNFNIQLEQMKQMDDTDSFDEPFENKHFLTGYYTEESIENGLYELINPVTAEQGDYQRSMYPFKFDFYHYNSPIKLPFMSRASYNVGSLVGSNIDGTISSIDINEKRVNNGNFVGFIGGIAGSLNKGVFNNIKIFNTDKFEDLGYISNENTEISTDFLEDLKQKNYYVTYNNTPVIPTAAVKKNNITYQKEILEKSKYKGFFEEISNTADNIYNYCSNYRLRPIINAGGLFGKISLTNINLEDNFITLNNVKSWTKNTTRIFSTAANGYEEIFNNYGSLAGIIETKAEDIASRTNYENSFKITNTEIYGIFNNQNEDESFERDIIHNMNLINTNKFYQSDIASNIHRFEEGSIRIGDNVFKTNKQPFCNTLNSDDVDEDSTENEVKEKLEDTDAPYRVGPNTLMQYCIDLPIFNASNSDDNSEYACVWPSNIGLGIFTYGEKIPKGISANNYEFTYSPYIGEDYEFYEIFYDGKISGKNYTSINYVPQMTSGDLIKNIKSNAIKIFGYNKDKNRVLKEYSTSQVGYENEPYYSRGNEDSKRRVYFNKLFIDNNNTAEYNETDYNKVPSPITGTPKNIFDKSTDEDTYFYYTYSTNQVSSNNFDFEMPISFKTFAKYSENHYNFKQGYVFNNGLNKEFDGFTNYGNYVCLGNSYSPSALRDAINKSSNGEVSTSGISADNNGFGGILVTDSANNCVMFIDNADDVELRGNPWCYKTPVFTHYQYENHGNIVSSSGLLLEVK